MACGQSLSKSCRPAINPARPGEHSKRAWLFKVSLLGVVDRSLSNPAQYLIQFLGPAPGIPRFRHSGGAPFRRLGGRTRLRSRGPASTPGAQGRPWAVPPQAQNNKRVAISTTTRPIRAMAASRELGWDMLRACAWLNPKGNLKIWPGTGGICPRSPHHATRNGPLGAMGSVVELGSQ